MLDIGLNRRTVMNIIIPLGIFSAKETYRSKNGLHFFVFDFVDQDQYIDIICKRHPSFNGRDPDVRKTHLYSSGRICFVEGKEPRSLWEAKMRAKEWAEYIQEYIRTGKAQS
jgi:hypothetical protein